MFKREVSKPDPAHPTEKLVPVVAFKAPYEGYWRPTPSQIKEGRGLEPDGWIPETLWIKYRTARHDVDLVEWEIMRTLEGKA